MTNAMYDVAIAGMGPTGLTLAHLLGRRGLKVIILEREPQFYGNARAVYTDDECMRIFQAAGIVEELEADMMIDTPAQWVFKDGSVLGQFVRTDRPYGWSMSNFLYQPYLETSMEQLLARYPNVTIRRGRELSDFEQDDEHVTIRHGATGGSSYGAGKQAAGLADLETIHARYLVGCDGGRSTVRTRLGIALNGKSFPNPWLVVDLRMKGQQDCFHHLPYFNFYCDPECPTVSCPQPDGHHRFEFMLMPGQTKEHMEDPATIRQLLARHVNLNSVEILRKLVYTFNALVAERWREQRIFLAGDAAHMTPQFMGQGMSSGVRDASNLAWKLDAVLRGQADDNMLDTYESERKPHAKLMIDISVRMKDFVSQSNPAKALLRNLVVRTMLATPGIRNYVREGRFKPAPTYDQGSYFGVPRTRRHGPEGRPIAQPIMRTFEGRHVRFDDVLGEGWSLVGFGCDPTRYLPEALRQQLESLGTSFITAYPLGMRPQGPKVPHSGPRGVVEVEDLHGALATWMRTTATRRGHIAVIRPDKFVYALVTADALASTIRQFLHRLGQPRSAPISQDHHEQRLETLAS